MTMGREPSFETIELRLDGPVAELVLARPDCRNAMDERMGAEIELACERLARQEGLRALLVRGKGASFSAGGDFSFIEERTRASHEANVEAMLRFYGRFLAIRRVPVPTVAVIHGHAVGAGLCFALACDLRLASVDAKLGASFVRIGLHPGMGATALLPALVGPAVAADLLLTGRTVGAEEALRLGLVSSVHPTVDLLEAARRQAGRIAEAGPVAVRQLVRTLRAPLDAALVTALQREAACQAADYATEDVQEAIAAFREKRPPRFVGR